MWGNDCEPDIQLHSRMNLDTGRCIFDFGKQDEEGNLMKLRTPVGIVVDFHGSSAGKRKWLYH